jgi:ankyrin repeat protein
MRWYDHPVLDAVKNNNLAALSQLQRMGASMEACNQYCESVLHFAARKASLDMVQFMLSHGARCFVDDGGRLPMHDVCWRARPAFDIVSLLLNHDLTMLLVQDRFGAFPLDYVNSRQWKEWCRFLDSIKDQYWPVRVSDNSNNINTTEELEHQEEQGEEEEGAYPDNPTALPVDELSLSSS